MEELDEKISQTLHQLEPTNKVRHFNDWALTALIAALLAMGFIYATQTKPKDVLQQVNQMQIELNTLRAEIQDSTRPADVLKRVESLQEEIIGLKVSIREIDRLLKIKEVP